MRVDRALRSDHTDFSGFCCPCSSARPRADHANDWQVEFLTKRHKRMRSGCIACDYHRFHSLIFQIGRDLPAVTNNRLRTLRPVRHSRRITEIDDALVRKLSHQLAYDCQSADAGVQYSAWLV